MFAGAGCKYMTSLPWLFYSLLGLLTWSDVRRRRLELSFLLPVLHCTGHVPHMYYISYLYSYICAAPAFFCCSLASFVHVPADQVTALWQRLHVGGALHRKRHAHVSLQHGVVRASQVPLQLRRKCFRCRCLYSSDVSTLAACASTALKCRYVRVPQVPLQLRRYQPVTYTGSIDHCINTHPSCLSRAHVKVLLLTLPFLAGSVY